MEFLSRLRSRPVIFAHDLGMVALAWLGAYWLRFNLSHIPNKYLSVALASLPFVILIQGIIFRLLGLYRGVWRFASIPDLVRIGRAVLLGGLGIFLLGFLHNRLLGVPRSVIPLYTVLLLFFLSGPRILYRMSKDRGAPSGQGKVALIVGAGCAGEMLVRDLRRERNPQFEPVAFVDDDSRKKGREIHGLRVRGATEQIPRLVRSLGIEVILIALPSAKERDMRRIVEICEGTRVPFLTLPSVQEVLAGGVTGTLRDVSIEDLLGRDPIKLDHESVKLHLRSKRVLVTGGGGSIGSQLCREVVRFPIDRLVIIEQCEYNLYRIQADLLARAPDLPIHAILGDVTDQALVERALQTHGPDVIFHAAAYKHVPLLEAQHRAAARNNIIGTRVMAEAAAKARVGEFVLISTDKAVNPTNVMGACKRVAEMVVQSLNGQSSTQFVTVRFGNVLDSAGSVVPLFREQIKRGGPVTVTHPDITRYFMTIPEACQLIMQAAVIGQGGEVFVLDMGEPVKVAYLAEQMIRLSGKRPGIDMAIKYVGLRPGEKMYEELFHQDEPLARTQHRKLLLAQSRTPEPAPFAAHLDALKQACDSFDEAGIAVLLKELVPEFAPDTVDRPDSDRAAQASNSGARPSGACQTTPAPVSFRPL
jgi:FlaA1/EpsC-like NDP-sugar epimerase